jgi:endonuclease/exonuclease/phosphatase (EEP) superfamily protein YafD
VIWALGLLFVAVSAVLLAARYVSGGSLVFLALTAFSPYGIGAAAIGAVLCAVARGRAGFVGLAVGLVLLLVSLGVRIPLYISQAAPAAGQRVVVMTCNLRLGSADAAAVVSAVRSNDVDVLMLEELTPDERDALRTAGLDGLLPHAVADPVAGAGGTGVWSRWPLESGKIRADFAFALVTAGVELPGNGRLAVVGLHLAGPTADASAWDQDIRHLPSVLQSLPRETPVIVGGDFNATVDDPRFRALLAAGYADGADQAGAGYTMTYPADRWYPPLIAIDHVLTRDAVARQAWTVHVPGSDHRALLASVVVPQEPPAG